MRRDPRPQSLQALLSSVYMAQRFCFRADWQRVAISGGTADRDPQFWRRFYPAGPFLGGKRVP